MLVTAMVHLRGRLPAVSLHAIDLAASQVGAIGGATSEEDLLPLANSAHGWAVAALSGTLNVSACKRFTCLIPCNKSEISGRVFELIERELLHLAAKLDSYPVEVGNTLGHWMLGHSKRALAQFYH